jgi:hypothetical protein
VTQVIASAVPRRRIARRGRVVSVTTSEDPWLRTDVGITDGTATFLLRFVCRSSVPGMDVDRSIEGKGTPTMLDGDLVMPNPLYSFDGAG